MIAFEKPQHVESPDGCYFYHTTELPQFGLQRGDWDLRPVAEKYTGGLNYLAKRVLDVGSASGFNTFWIEQRGAEVVSFDQSEQHPLNLLPGWDASLDDIRRMKRSYWLTHRLLGSKAKAYYGNIYDIDPELGLFDVAFVGSILLHLENPVGALRSITARCRDTIVVTEALHDEYHTKDMRFRPGWPSRNDYLFWWYLPPETIHIMLESFGFEVERVEQLTATSPKHGSLKLYSMVAKRVGPVPDQPAPKPELVDRMYEV